MKKFLFILTMILLMFLVPVCSLAAETPWGKVPVVGFREEKAGKSGRMWAPIDVKLSDDPYALGDVYLEYRYVRFDSKTRAWQMKLVDKQGNTYPYSGYVKVTFPYPCKWDYKTGKYWKWNRDYADRFQWAYSIGESEFAYENYEGDFCVAGYFRKSSIGYDEYYEYDDPEWAEKVGQNFIKIDVERDDGHRLNLLAQDGMLPSICIRIYDIEPSFDDCEIRTTYLTYSFGDDDIWYSFYKTYTETFRGFLIDSRPEQYKKDVQFMTFLEKNESTLGYYDFLKNFIWW